MVTKNNNEQLNHYNCVKCGFTTQYKCNYNNHLMTAKHKMVINDDIKPSKNYDCICGKEYKHRQGLNRHKKECTYESIQPPVENLVMDTTMILNIMKENQEFKTLLFEQSKQVMELQAKQSEMFFEFQKENNNLINKFMEREPGNNNTINGNVTNNNTNKFNLNFFLNETCKDAINIQEFMENIRITFPDLLKIGNEGFVNGVSDIFIKQLQDLDVNKRPIHCTDSKRETIYFKEEDVWNKDDKDKTKLKQIIEKIEYRNVAALRDWCNENPDARVNNSPNNLLKDKIYFQTLQGDERTRDKIIKNISKEVIVDKE